MLGLSLAGVGASFYAGSRARKEESKNRKKQRAEEAALQAELQMREKQSEAGKTAALARQRITGSGAPRAAGFSVPTPFGFADVGGGGRRGLIGSTGY